MILEGDMELLKEQRCDINVAAGLLKTYLRELPESILTTRLHRSFLDVTDLLDRNDRLIELARLVSMLPVAQYTLLRTLIAHLITIVQHSETNKMTVRNVGIVFSPTLAIPAGIFTLMMAEFEIIFDIDDTPLFFGVPSTTTTQMPENNRDTSTPPRAPEEPEQVTIVPMASTPSTTPQQTSGLDIKMESRASKRRSQLFQNMIEEDQGPTSHRNSQIYIENAPDVIKMYERALLQQRDQQFDENGLLDLSADEDAMEERELDFNDGLTPVTPNEDVVSFGMEEDHAGGRRPSTAAKTNTVTALYEVYSDLISDQPSSEPYFIPPPPPLVSVSQPGSDEVVVTEEKVQTDGDSIVVYSDDEDDDEEDQMDVPRRHDNRYSFMMDPKNSNPLGV